MEPSKYQRAIYTTFRNTNCNITISAVAGSGKTTTLLDLLQFVPESKKTIFLAFNNSVVDELRTRNKNEHVQIMTIHSCGLRAIRNRYGNVKVNPDKAIAKVGLFMKKHPEKIQKNRIGYYYYIVPKIVDLMRCNLVDCNVEDINKMLEHYALLADNVDVEIAMEVFKLMQKDKHQFDFMDMIYQPVIEPTMRVVKYDYVFCDESQDFSLCQQQFIRRLINRNGRVVTVGDPRQAIYGFAGADNDSYNKLAEINGKSVRMPLSVCYRCGKNIVLEAKNIVDNIQYNPDSIDGVVENGSLTNLKQGDWILCRNLKPLVQTYLWLMKNRVKSKIRGKDIGEGILGLLTKIGVKRLEDLKNCLDEEYDRLMAKLKARGVKRPDYHPKAELLLQRSEVLLCLAEQMTSVKELRECIEDIFTDEVKGILLSTIHKSKGLENNTIYFLCPELIPSRFAVMDWQFEQEQNLRYVAITRAKKHLIYVSGEQFIQDITNKVNIRK